MTKQTDMKTYHLDGWVIVPPLLPWDVNRKAEIWPEMSYGTFARSAGEAWRRHCQTNLVHLDKGELSIRIQRWHDKGYRAKRARLEIYDE